MSNSSNVLANYVALMKDKPEENLGLLVLYSVTEVNVAHADLERQLIDAGLGDHVPRRPADVDVFRRTATEAQRKRRPIPNEPDQYVNVLVRDVTNDDDEVVKRIVCEIVDKGNRRLAYSEVYNLIFTKATSAVDIRRIGRTKRPEADEVAMEIATEYKRQVGTVDAACVRTVIGRILDRAEATSMRPGGGAYFVTRDHAETVAGLESLAEVIPGTMINSVPLRDDPKQRQNLMTAVEDQAKVDIQRQVDEIATFLNAGEPVTAEKMAHFLGNYRDIAGRTEKYRDLLDATLSGTNTLLKVYKAQTRKLAELGTRPAIVPQRKTKPVLTVVAAA